MVKSIIQSAILRSVTGQAGKVWQGRQAKEQDRTRTNQRPRQSGLYNSDMSSDLILGLYIFYDGF